MNKLVIAEKPSVALRLALSLAEDKPKRHVDHGVSYFELSNRGDKLFVVAAVGHLFTVTESSQEKGLPLFSVEWKPLYKVEKSAYYTKRYLDIISTVGKNCDVLINACDYDIEGSVIGTNIMSYLLYGDPNKDIVSGEKIRRMHFSTTTKQDLLNAYNNLEPFDRGNFEAGATRHILDWIWGINLSRALMRALSKAGKYRTLSIGRVQGPALAILVKREQEIESFVPRDFWTVGVVVKGKEFLNVKGKIFDKEAADKIAEKAKKAGKALVYSIEKENKRIFPLPPFDLTDLQITASAVLGFDPSKTLQIAQSLYERSYISYPRTSSQKLPYTLNLPRIIKELGEQESYRAYAEELISRHRFVPVEGKKEDEAHPAIFPTGEKPSKLSKEEEKLYDLIVRRFLSVFAEPAIVEKTTVLLKIDDEAYAAEGEKVVEPGWLLFYKYYAVKESVMPDLDRGETAEVEKVVERKGTTKPPERYTKAMLIQVLESKNLGTKATRAEIVDTLFKRGYVRNSRIEVTPLGRSVYNALSLYAPEIVDENLTRKLEEDMDGLVHGRTTREHVIDEGKEIITRALGKFQTHEKEIGSALLDGVAESEKPVVLGKCPNCGGDLLLRHSKNGKNYAICSNWPKCNTSYPLPANATIVPTGKTCEICHTPIVKVFMKGKVFTMDLDPNCPSKANWKSKGKKKAEA